MAFQPNDDAAWLSLFRQHMDEMFNYMFRMREQGSVRHEFVPYIDIFEASSNYVIEIDLPGFSESDFSITQIGSALLVEGVKRQDRCSSAMSYICLERNFGRFSRTVEIPASFDPGSMKSFLRCGVLTITVGKKE